MVDFSPVMVRDGHYNTFQQLSTFDLRLDGLLVLDRVNRYHKKCIMSVSPNR